MVLDVVVVIRDTEYRVDWKTRYCGIPKDQLTIGCIASLVNSITKSNIDVKLVVLDDHCSNDTKSKIKSIVDQSKIKFDFIELDDTGYNKGLYKQWTLCRDSNADLVYSVEDDYLHSPSAIQEMVDSYVIFCNRLKRNNIVVYPFDEPTEYDPPSRTDFIVHGSARHWRTGIFTTNVLMCSPQLFKDNWSLFEKLALNYNDDFLNPQVEHYEPSNTIWNIWANNQGIRFNPIPSLALHMGVEDKKDPFINWKQWWTEYAA